MPGVDKGGYGREAGIGKRRPPLADRRAHTLAAPQSGRARIIECDPGACHAALCTDGLRI